MSRALHEVRHGRLMAALAGEGCDAVVVWGNAWQGDYLRYATDFAAIEGDAIAVAMADGAIRLFVDNPAEAERAAADCPWLEARWGPSPVALAIEHLEGLRDLALAAAPAITLPRALAGRGMADATAAMDALLMAKAPEEIAAVRRAAVLADGGYRAFMAASRPGRPEYEVVADVEAFFRAEGCPDNFMLLGSGGTEMRGMHPAGERRLQPGDLVTTELTPCVDGYYAQICRTLVIGEPSPAQLDAFDVYIEAAAAGEAVLRAGVTAAAVARAENDVFRAHGLGEYTTSEYTRVRGHCAGLFPDSKPQILEDVDTVFPDGATAIVHPNTYHPIVGYMVLGDMSIVTHEGCEPLATIPRALLPVEG